MTIVEAIKSCFRQYFRFSGRASRAEFWKYTLFIGAVSIVLIVVNSLIFGPVVTIQTRLDANGVPTGIRYVSHIYISGVIGTVLCLLAVAWRRMHDTGARGLWVLAPPVLTVFLIVAVIALNIGLPEMIHILHTQEHARVYNPFGGGTVLLAILAVWMTFVIRLAKRSSEDSNKYGPNPIEVTP